MSKSQRSADTHCSRCRQSKPKEKFGVVIDGVIMDVSVCADCVAPDFYRSCRQCGKRQPLTSYDGCLVGLHRRMSVCRSCARALAQAGLPHMSAAQSR